MQSKEYVLVEEELRYSRAAELKVRGKDVQRYHIPELWRPRLSDVVDLVIPQHVMDRKMPRELLEQNEALLKSALARATRGQGWD